MPVVSPAHKQNSSEVVCVSKLLTWENIKIFHKKYYSVSTVHRPVSETVKPVRKDIPSQPSSSMSNMKESLIKLHRPPDLFAQCGGVMEIGMWSWIYRAQRDTEVTKLHLCYGAYISVTIAGIKYCLQSNIWESCYFNKDQANILLTCNNYAPMSHEHDSAFKKHLYMVIMEPYWHPTVRGSAHLLLNCPPIILTLSGISR